MKDFSKNQRYCFAQALYKVMEKNHEVFLLLGDLGYGVFDKHREAFPDRVINCGAAEQAMMGMAVGLSQAGKTPFVYSITPFLLYRPWETIRTYVNHERCNVKLIGSGRNDDYKHDGKSHDASDDRLFLSHLENIMGLWPKDASQINEAYIQFIAEDPRPYYLNLKR